MALPEGSGLWKTPSPWPETPSLTQRSRQQSSTKKEHTTEGPGNAATEARETEERKVLVSNEQHHETMGQFKKTTEFVTGVPEGWMQT